MPRKYTAVFIAVLCPVLSWAGDLFVPFSLESASVLPKGVRSVRVGAATTSLENKWNESGNIEPMGDAFNINVKWKDLGSILGKSDQSQILKGQIHAYMKANQLSEQAVVGEAYGVVNTRVTTTIPSLAYGLTERWTLAVAVPVIYSNMNIDTGWSPKPVVAETMKAFSQGGQATAVRGLLPVLQNVIHAKNDVAGYQELKEEKRTEMGDVNLFSKYQFYKAPKVALAATQKIVLPTGRAADVDKLVDVPSGDGQYDVGVGLNADYYATARWTLMTGVSYTAQLPDRRTLRIPDERGTRLTPDKEDKVQRDLGDIVGGTFGTRYTVWNALSIGGAYGLQYKSIDKYKGGRYSGERYEWMSDDTEQTMQTAQVGVSYSTVSLYTSRKFSLPMDTSLNYVRVLSGRNVKDINMLSFDLAVYF